jgi:hypothetical protein
VILEVSEAISAVPIGIHPAFGIAPAIAILQGLLEAAEEKLGGI